jgi:acyl-CoA thioesterase YciA
MFHIFKKKDMELINTHPIRKSDLGFHGNLFGGALMSWIDLSAASYAMQICETPRMVTIKIDECIFKRPAKESQLLKIYGKVNVIGNTSITLYIEARSHNVYSQKQDVILSTNIKFVRVDELGEPVPISERIKKKYNNLN